MKTTTMKTGHVSFYPTLIGALVFCGLGQLSSASAQEKLQDGEAAVVHINQNRQPGPTFIQYSTSLATEQEQKVGLQIDFGIPERDVTPLIDAVCLAVYRGSFPKSRSVTGLAGNLRDLVDDVIRNRHVEHPSRLLRQWLCAEAICAWVVSNVDGDPALAAETDFKRWWDGIRPEITLSHNPPRTICSGAALLARNLARALAADVGLQARYVGGWLRADNGLVPTASNHAWTCFVFDGGLEVPADVVSPMEPLEERKRWTYKRGAWPILPRSPEAWEVFLAFHYGLETFRADEWEPFPKNLQDPFTSLTLTQWRATTDIFAALKLRRTRQRVD